MVPDADDGLSAAATRTHILLSRIWRFKSSGVSDMPWEPSIQGSALRTSSPSSSSRRSRYKINHNECALSVFSTVGCLELGLNSTFFECPPQDNVCL